LLGSQLAFWFCWSISSF